MKNTKDELEIQFSSDTIEIHRNGYEDYFWIIDEWKEDPEVVFSIVNAVRLAMLNELPEGHWKQVRDSV